MTAGRTLGTCVRAPHDQRGCTRGERFETGKPVAFALGSGPLQCNCSICLDKNQPFPSHRHVLATLHTLVASTTRIVPLHYYRLAVDTRPRVRLQCCSRVSMSMALRECACKRQAEAAAWQVPCAPHLCHVRRCGRQGGAAAAMPQRRQVQGVGLLAYPLLYRARAQQNLARNWCKWAARAPVSAWHPMQQLQGFSLLLELTEAQAAWAPRTPTRAPGAFLDAPAACGRVAGAITSHNERTLVAVHQHHRVHTDEVEREE